MDMRTEGARHEGHAGHLRRQAGLIPESKLSVYRRAAMGKLSLNLVTLGGRMVLYGLPPASLKTAAAR
jgi:hypothetical protein